MADNEAERAGELLIEEGIVTREELAQAIAEQGLKGSPLAAVLDAAPHVSRGELAAFLTAKFRIPVIEDLRKVPLSQDAARLVPEKLARKHELVPVARIGPFLCIAKPNYFNRAAIQELRKATSLKIKVLQADGDQVRAAIERVYKGNGMQIPPPKEAPKLEAIPLISMSDEPARPAPPPPRAPAPVVRPAAVPPPPFRPAPVAARASQLEEVVEIMDAVRLSAGEYASATRPPFVALVAEFDEIFRSGKAVSPHRLS